MKYFFPDQKIAFERGILDEKTFLIVKKIVFIHPEVKVIVHPGFITDGASISFGRYLIGCPFEKKYLGPAIIHDALYIHGENRGWANNIFYDALIDINFKKWKSVAMRVAVDIGGPFVNYTDKQVEDAKKYLEIEK